MSDWAERMTVLMREQGAALNSPAPQLATMTGNNTLSIGQLTLDADDLVFSAHLLNNSDVPVLKAGDTVTVLRMSDSRYWVMDKVGGGMIYNGLGQTTAGTMLDATQGTALDARIDEVEEAASAAGEAAGSAQSAAEAAQAAAAKKVDAAITTGYGVLNETYIDTSGYNKLWYRRQGAVVVVNLSLYMKETVSDNAAVLASGLPEARANEDYPVMDTTQQKEKILGVNSSGEIVINWGTLSAGDRIRGTLVYIAR